MTPPKRLIAIGRKTQLAWNREHLAARSWSGIQASGDSWRSNALGLLRAQTARLPVLATVLILKASRQGAEAAGRSQLYNPEALP